MLRKLLRRVIVNVDVWSLLDFLFSLLVGLGFLLRRSISVGLLHGAFGLRGILVVGVVFVVLQIQKLAGGSMKKGKTMIGNILKNERGRVSVSVDDKEISSGKVSSALIAHDKLSKYM